MTKDSAPFSKFHINRLSLYLALILALFSYAAYQPLPLIHSAALWFDDLKLKLQYESSPDAIVQDIVVVEVDEPSVNQLGRWPWNRTTIAGLIAGLSKASVVGLDMVFSETSSANDDVVLAKAIADSGNVVLGYFFQTESTQNVPQLDQDMLEECSLFNVSVISEPISLPEFRYAETNIATIQENALSCGFFTIQPDGDGLYRQYLLTAIHKGMVLPSLALQMLRFHQNSEPALKLGSDVFDMHLTDREFKKNTLRVSYPKNIERVSAYKIINGELAKDFFRGKLVIVGVTETGLFDMRSTPVDSTMPGVLMHAFALNDMLKGSDYQESVAIDWLLLGFCFLICIVAFYIRKLEIRLAIYLGMIVLLSGVSYVLLLNGLWVQEFYAILFLALSSGMTEIVLFRETNQRAKYLRSAFSSYVSDDLVKQIISQPESLSLGGTEKEISILFSDIRNFTSLSETLSPTELISVLNEFFDPLTRVAMLNHGMLDKYIGDAMMVLFNAPVDVEGHADKACIAALEMIDLTGVLNTKIADRVSTPIEIGIGVNTGDAVVGNVGSSERFSYTALGDSVNTASRLEGLTKRYGVNVIISEYTRASLQKLDYYDLRHLDRVRVKGKQEAMDIYELCSAGQIIQDLRQAYE
ncbi:MAG: adenylate/guanylate cyclase domain-containing protein, partial [Gammaproteobacteria bacterium]|nr:adenylate/guanylate cyclase domain-containing protein [Gammaproteobacteria bacterium]